MKREELEEVIRQVGMRCDNTHLRQDQRDHEMFIAGMLIAADIKDTWDIHLAAQGLEYPTDNFTHQLPGFL